MGRKCEPPGDMIRRCQSSLGKPKNYLIGVGFCLGSHSQPRQHEADQCDGVFRLFETHPGDQPQPHPTDEDLTRDIVTGCMFNPSLKVNV
jgi:hypothetical protein